MFQVFSKEKLHNYAFIAISNKTSRLTETTFNIQSSISYIRFFTDPNWSILHIFIWYLVGNFRNFHIIYFVIQLTFVCNFWRATIWFSKLVETFFTIISSLPIFSLADMTWSRVSVCFSTWWHKFLAWLSTTAFPFLFPICSTKSFFSLYWHHQKIIQTNG